MAKLKELSNYYLIFEIIHFLPAIFEWYITHIVERRLSIHVFFMTVFSLNSTKKIYFIIFQLFLYDN